LSAPHQLEVVDGEDLAFSVFPRVILKDDHLAGGNVSPKYGSAVTIRAKVWAGVVALELALSILVDDDLAGVSGAAIRCDHPKDIGKKIQHLVSTAGSCR